MPPSKLSATLFTDLYQLTMAQAYWQSGSTAQATFSLYFRSHPPNRAYWVCAGLEDVLGFLEGFGFSDDDVAFLRSLDKFDDGFLDYLGHLRFSGSVRALGEATVFFANEPVIEVTAPVIEGQIVETFLVNQVECIGQRRCAPQIYNVPDGLFAPKLAPAYTGILDWLKTATLEEFQCQNWPLPLFGPQPEQWSVNKARTFVKGLQEMWDTWG